MIPDLILLGGLKSSLDKLILVVSSKAMDLGFCFAGRF